MPYKPNYCCNCGGKVDRPNWNRLTSRMFCENCESDFRKEEWLPKGVSAAAAILASIFSLGLYLKSPVSDLPVSKGKNAAVVTEYSEKKQQVNLVSENRVNNSLPVNTQNTTDFSRPSSADQKVNQTQNTFQNTAAKQTKTEPEYKSENIVYYCGAQTKKGTACTRRVKNKDLRCWQHTGMPPMR